MHGGANIKLWLYLLLRELGSLQVRIAHTISIKRCAFASIFAMVVVPICLCWILSYSSPTELWLFGLGDTTFALESRRGVVAAVKIWEWDRRQDETVIAVRYWQLLALGMLVLFGMAWYSSICRRHDAAGGV